jgi:alkylation response protein AidB-like acyl-CoA dehydrogenase
VNDSPLAPDLVLPDNNSPGITSRGVGFAHEAVRQAAAVAASGAGAADRERRLADETLTALDDAGFAGHFVPRRWGGREGTFGELFAAVATVAEGCGSAAWCALLWAWHARFAALLPEEGQREIWAESAGTRIAAAIMPPSGTARPVSDGWLVSGRWNVVSGVDHADWVLVAAPERTRAGQCEQDARPGPVRVFAVPRTAVTVLDTWRSTGLRATASNSVTLEETLVPEHRSVDFGTLLKGDGAQRRARCHAVPARLVGGLLFCAPALGAARAALTAWSERAARPNATALKSSTARECLARSSADVDAIALLLREGVRRADISTPTPRLTARNLRDAAVAADRLAAAVDAIFRTGGSQLLDETSDLHRHWRDVLTASSHGALRLEAAADAFADSLLSPATQSDRHAHV